MQALAPEQELAPGQVREPVLEQGSGQVRAQAPAQEPVVRVPDSR
ncbi:unnamed protein product [marine sediment metagenome]|uniref:Uncharacterized protein n=1 Tax=marine sediment metagenome TaxID=412755 RepID=X1UJM4_9ZZZZ